MLNKTALVILLLIINLTWALAQVPGFFMKEDKRRVTIPFLASNSLIILPVSINGNYPINFLVDTGVRSNILFSKNLGDAMGLEYSRRINLLGADGSEELMASISPINHLDLGPVEGRLQSLLVLEEDFLELESVIGVPIYGIIGYEFFKFNPVKINYDEGKMDFYSPEAIKWAPPFYKKLPMTVENGKPYILAKIKQKEGASLNSKLLIDTGANHGLLLNRETSTDIKLPPLFLETELGQSLGGVLYGLIGRVDALKIGGLKLQQVLTSYPEETAFSHIILETGRLGSLGSEILGRTRMILDYPRGRALMKRGEGFYAPFQFDMSGVVIKKIPTDETRFYIGMVRPGSPAYKAGIKQFDEILKVNKIPAELWDLSDMIKLLKSEEGKEIQFELRRYFDETLTTYEDLKIMIELKRQI
ncbi:aspartyl protease family protein [Algoriphagus sp. CAU 1675]|uniref:aspartyl protease family protein n=1 Tax=Algoriphagus sp. CAU 1675 TaxID=3032597 RepID=UPI0023DA2FC9|nr:aspartyl protease family protein [Algoriphagus sp. CAU 1675]MDF2156561.1 aspartyl protease family protein [Algoriphagus sp. CAU 1675]